MTVYLDTSALIKLYFEEEGSDEVRARLQHTSVVATSRLAYAETCAAVGRKIREGLLDLEAQGRALADFEKDWKSYFVMEVSEPVCRLAGELVAVHPLRASDAVHLASALLIQSRIGEQVEFRCFDRRLSETAAAEGLAIA